MRLKQVFQVILYLDCYLIFLNYRILQIKRHYLVLAISSYKRGKNLYSVVSFLAFWSVNGNGDRRLIVDNDGNEGEILHNILFLM